MKNNKGITLIALIVIIIILIILAGVSILAAIGDDGLINEAKQATSDSNRAALVEEISSEVLRKYSTTTGRLTEAELASILKEYGTLSSETDLLNQTITTEDGTVIKVTEVFTGKLDTTGSGTSVDVELSAEVVVDSTSGINQINVKTVLSNYTGNKNLEDLYYRYYTKLVTDDDYTLKGIGQNLTELSFTLPESGSYVIRVEIGEKETNDIIGIDTLDGGIDYEAPEITYTVTFYAEDKSTVLQTVTVSTGETATYTGTIPTKSGYTFQYWVEDGETLEFDFGNVTADTKLYPYFSYTGVCFVKGTKVLTENGLVNIEDVQIGMKVLSYNEETKEVEVKEVKNTFINYVSYNMCKVTAGGVTVESTDGHDYYVVGKGWTDACELEVGDILLNRNNQEVIVEKVEVIKTDGLTTVYNFEVEDNHNYYVGESSVLVHNAAPSIGDHGCSGETVVVPTTYTVKFYAEDKSTVLQSVTVEEGGTASYTGTTPTKSGYTFKYWVADGETTEYELDNITSSVNLYPYFTSSVCFAKGTKVLAENGLVNIEDIEIGMKVLSYNEKTKEVEVKVVKNTFINYVSYDMCKVTVGGVTVESTDGHEYYVVGKGWTDACELKVGDVVLNSNNEEMMVEKVEVIKTNGLTTVYNFEVEDNHNYYVGENSVLVHNSDSSVCGHGGNEPV